MKTNSFILSREITEVKTEIEAITVELSFSSNKKTLVCCCYRPPNADKKWLEKFILFLAESLAQNNNMLICGDFNFPGIHWKSPEETRGVDEVQFTELLSDYLLNTITHLSNKGKQYP